MVHIEYLKFGSMAGLVFQTLFSSKVGGFTCTESGVRVNSEEFWSDIGRLRRGKKALEQSVKYRISPLPTAAAHVAKMLKSSGHIAFAPVESAAELPLSMLGCELTLPEQHDGKYYTSRGHLMQAIVLACAVSLL